MHNLIDREALKRDVRDVVFHVADTPLSNDPASKLIFKMGELVRKKIDDAPGVDAEPVQHGRWIGTSCSNCLSDLSSWADAAYGVIENGDLMWCPHCGAKMDGDESENTCIT